jgi:hypothetical protein
MRPVSGEENQQIEKLTTALVDMNLYLGRLEQGCEQIAEIFYDDKATALENLAQIMKGLGYCSKLIQSATTLLAVDGIAERFSAATFNTGLEKLLKNLDQAAISEDYSLLTDIAEYDLITVIHSGQELLRNLLQHCSEGKV